MKRLESDVNHLYDASSNAAYAYMLPSIHNKRFFNNLCHYILPVIIIILILPF